MTGFSDEEREFTVYSGACMHTMRQSDLTPEEEYTSQESTESCTTITHKSGIDRTLYDNTSECDNHYYRRSHCLRQRCGMFTTVHQLEDTPRWVIFVKQTGVPVNGRKTITHIDTTWKDCVPIVAYGVIVDTSTRSDAGRQL